MDHVFGSEPRQRVVVVVLRLRICDTRPASLLRLNSKIKVYVGQILPTMRAVRACARLHQRPKVPYQVPTYLGR